MEQEKLVSTAARQILEQVSTAIVGKSDVLLWVLCAMLAQGHILLEDIPGVGKTTMALAFSKTMGLQCNRMQFTPDVLPSDVTGYSVMDPKTGTMTYQSGAVLCNLFLADELNRATSRTQSALLEAMEEGQVTVDGISHPIPRPFVVMATQNPTGAAGTQLLPDSQMDRFMVRLSLGYPSQDDEAAMVTGRQQGNPLHSIQPVLDTAQLQQLQELVQQTYISEEVVRYAVQLIAATRSHEHLLQGASPRATLAMVSMAKACARLHSRDYVLPEDVQAVFINTVAHRLQLTAQAQTKHITAKQILQGILRTQKAPQLS